MQLDKAPDGRAGFFAVAATGEVVRTSLKVSFVVGTILAVINHGSALVDMSLTPARLLQILLTYSVPYCVSSYSMVKAIRQRNFPHS